jgi:hypothetical protein
MSSISALNCVGNLSWLILIEIRSVLDESQENRVGVLWREIVGYFKMKGFATDSKTGLLKPSVQSYKTARNLPKTA